MENRYVKYFEVTHGTQIHCFTCFSTEQYQNYLQRMLESYPDLELVYREWSDGVIEDGIIEKEDWNIG